jgi:SAM-dependent methyltransferase
MNRLQRIYYKEKFNPSLIGLFLNPFYFARKALYQSVKNNSSQINGKILDVGCGKKPYKNIFTYTEYIGLDIDNEGHDHSNEDIDIFYDGVNFPFMQNTFDCLLVNQVLEHVFNPNDFLLECNRVLKKDGLMLITVPFLWDEHEQPFDFGRYSSFGIKSILEKANFEIVNSEKTLNDFRAVITVIILYFYKSININNKYLQFFLHFIFYFPFNMLGILLYRFLPKNKDLFVDNILLVKKI